MRRDRVLASQPLVVLVARSANNVSARNVARWDGNADTSTTYIPEDGWRPGGRMKQYLGGHNETWGGVTINIDSNFIDLGAGSVARPEGRCPGTRLGWAVGWNKAQFAGRDALLARIHHLHELGQCVQAARKAGVGVQLHQHLARLADREARIEALVQRRVQVRHVAGDGRDRPP